MAMILLVAGHETTANMISLGTFTLLEHPEQLAQLRAEESLMPTAVEELLRFLSIADGMLRVAKEDIEIGGQTIRADDGVVFSTSLINRDDTAYPAPDELDLGPFRPPPRGVRIRHPPVPGPEPRPGGDGDRAAFALHQDPGSAARRTGRRDPLQAG